MSKPKDEKPTIFVKSCNTKPNSLAWRKHLDELNRLKTQSEHQKIQSLVIAFEKLIKSHEEEAEVG